MKVDGEEREGEGGVSLGYTCLHSMLSLDITPMKEGGVTFASGSQPASATPARWTNARSFVKGINQLKYKQDMAVR